MDEDDEIRGGEVFDVRVTAEWFGGGLWTCRGNDGRIICIPPETLRASKRVDRPLAVGDRVDLKGSQTITPAVIQAIFGDWVWVYWRGSLHPSTVRLADLRRLPDEDKP